MAHGVISKVNDPEPDEPVPTRRPVAERAPIVHKVVHSDADGDTNAHRGSIAKRPWEL